MARSTDQGRTTKTLPIKSFDAPREEPSEILNGEVIDEDGPADRSGRRGPGQRSETRSRSRRSRTSRQESQRAQEQPRIDQLRQSDPATWLRREVDSAGKKYMENLRRSDILKEKKTPKQRTAQLTGLHKGYVSMMVLSCIQPLSDEISAKSVLTVVGMGSALWALSPNFRTQMGEFGTQLQEAVTAKIEDRKHARYDKAFSKLKPGDPLSQQWQSREERTKRGGRDMFTANSAGMTEVALTENAYAAMREPDADIEGILSAHEGLIKTLYEQAADDGLGAEEVARAARVVVGMRLNEEPELATVFQGLSHGQYAKSDPREVRLKATGETAWVWTGEFETRMGQTVQSGSFQLRAPMSTEQHQAAIADTMTADMVSLIRSQGVEGLNVGMVSYAAAWGLKDRPDFDEMLAMNSPLGERLLTSQLMMRTMDSDGVPPDEQQWIYSNAYVDAMEYVGALYPDIEEEWGERFGGNWRDSMRDFVRNPESYMNNQSQDSAAPSGSSAREAGPASPSAKYRNARINQNYIETAKTGFTGMGSDPSDFRDQDFEMGG